MSPFFAIIIILRSTVDSQFVGLTKRLPLIGRAFEGNKTLKEMGVESGGPKKPLEDFIMEVMFNIEIYQRRNIFTVKYSFIIFT